MKERHLIGFSLSFCLRDILQGKVDREEVLFIQTACAPRNDVERDEVIEQYSRTYWRDFGHKEIALLFDELLTDHRIGWASGYVKNTCNIGWGVWLSTHNTGKTVQDK